MSPTLSDKMPFNLAMFLLVINSICFYKFDMHGTLSLNSGVIGLYLGRVLILPVIILLFRNKTNRDVSKSLLIGTVIIFISYISAIAKSF